MSIVFIEEVGAPIRVCSKEATALALGVAHADLDLSELVHPTEHYTLVDGKLVELTELITKTKIEVTNKDARAKLAETDWYYIRFQETGVAVPESITLERQEMRELVLAEG